MVEKKTRKLSDDPPTNDDLKGVLPFLSKPLIGALSDVCGWKPFMLLAIVFTLAIPCLKISAWWYVTLFILSGLFSVTFSVVLVYVSDITKRHKQTTACGVVSTFSASMVTSPLVKARMKNAYFGIRGSAVAVFGLLFLVGGCNANQAAGFSCVNTTSFFERQCIEHAVINRLANEGWSTFSVATGLIFSLACVVTGVAAFGIPLSADVFRLRSAMRKIRVEVFSLEEGVAALKAAVKTDVAALKADVKTDVAALKADVQAFKADVQAGFQAVKTDVEAVKTDVEAVKTDVEAFKAEFQAVNATLARIVKFLETPAPVAEAR